MAASKPSSRYANVDRCPSLSLRGPSPDFNSTSTKLTSMKNSNSSGRRKPCDPIAVPIVTHNSSGLAKNNPPTFGTMVKKFMDKRSNSKFGSARRAELTIPADAIAEDLKKAVAKGSGVGFSNLHRKLFNRMGSADRAPRKALEEVSNNTRTLGMVLRSERELLNQNKEYEEEIAELRLLLEARNREVDKLKDLCLEQREEIKALKDVILFPDVINPRIQDMFEKQGSELKEARKIIPSLQQQVSSHAGQIQCLVEALAEVKADKKASKNCFDGLVSSPRTPTYDDESLDVSEFYSRDPFRVDDINPCLTPCFSNIKSKGYREVDYNYSSKDGHFQVNNKLCPDSISDSYGGVMSKSSEHCQKQIISINTSKRTCKSDENKWCFGKQRLQNMF